MIVFTLVGLAIAAVLIVLGAFWLIENVSFKGKNDE